MNVRIKYAMISVVLAVIVSIATISPTFAHGIPDPGPPTPITISGTITDHGTPVPGLVVVAWCGGLDNFGGSDTTNAHGFFEIHTTNSLDCPLNANGFLEIFHPGESVGFAFADVTIHTLTTVNVKLEDKHPIPVPEFGWLGGATALATGVGAIAIGRRRFVKR